nr:unnamed protein product [Callosobruchus analis]
MKSIETYTKYAKLIIEVATLLHNIVREVDGNGDQDFTGSTTNLENRSSTARSRRNNRASSRARSIRDQYNNYFVNSLI